LYAKYVVCALFGPAGTLMTIHVLLLVLDVDLLLLRFVICTARSFSSARLLTLILSHARQTRVNVTARAFD